MGGKMFEKTVSVNFYVSDFHMGEGVASQNEDFKYHEIGTPMHDTRNDYVLDEYFYNFIDWILENTKHCSKVQLYLNGDMFDFSTVSLPYKSISLPYEEDAVAKFKIIMGSHTEFFDALTKFCRVENTAIKFFIGNHDLQLCWPTIQEMILERISSQNPRKILFLHEEYTGSTHCRHGESEFHNKINHDKPIITAMEIAKLPSAIKNRKLNQAMHDVLDVSISHYLNADLMYNLKKHHYLIGRMHAHDFVWLDGLKYIGRKSWYRDRWFFFHAFYYFFRTLIRYVFFAKFWHIKMKFGLGKILKILHWTFTGVLPGYTPKDSAIKILHNNESVECVIYSHEHVYISETIQINNKAKTYINTGTWKPLIRDKTKKQTVPWKKLRWLQSLLKFTYSIFTKHKLELVWRLPVGVETTDNCGNISRQLNEWDKEQKTLKQLS